MEKLSESADFFTPAKQLFEDKNVKRLPCFLE